MYTAETPKNNISKLDLMIGASGAFYVFSDFFFNKPVSWLEYDVNRRSLDFIMEDGEVRNYGQPVDDALAVHLERQSHAMLVRGSVNDVKEHAGYTLIVHR